MSTVQEIPTLVPPNCISPGARSGQVGESDGSSVKVPKVSQGGQVCGRLDALGVRVPVRLLRRRFRRLALRRLSQSLANGEETERRP